jgi:fructose-bisphosphate aldolase / 2-amino-3,7-dideoxy-D-threo-hept-6-ulosonate synthase
MSTGKELRLRRFFQHGRCVIVPMDHPLYFGPLKGLEDPGALVADTAATQADGVLLTLATLGRVTKQIGNLGTIARLDGTHTRLGKHLTQLGRVSSVEYAVACGADAGVLNIYPGADNEDELLLKLGETAEACAQWGLPLVGEMIPIGCLQGHYNAGAGKLSPDELADQVALAARLGAELGADLIKTNYTGSKESFSYVVKTATVPVIVAGGPCGDSEESLLQMVSDCLEAGAAGICIGRNVWQRENRVELLQKLCKIVHC